MHLYKGAWRLSGGAEHSKELSFKDAVELVANSDSEVAMGFMEGPFHDEASVSKRLRNGNWVYTPRFLIRQGASGKPRAIDDCRRSGLNNTFIVTEQLQLEDCLGKSMLSDGAVSVQLSDGTCLQAKIQAASSAGKFVGHFLFTLVTNTWWSLGWRPKKGL